MCCSTAACRAADARHWWTASARMRRCRAFLATDAGGVGLESAARLGGRQHGSALEPGGAGAADRAGASAGSAATGSRCELRLSGNDRGGDALASEVQEIPFCRGAGRRREGSFPRRQPAHALHGNGRTGDRVDSPSAGTRSAGRPADRDIVEDKAAFEDEPGFPPPSAADSSPTAMGDPWSALLTTGLSVLEQLAATTRAAPAGGNGPSVQSFVRRDERTGESYLRFPIPSHEVLDRALGAVAALLERYRK